MRKFEVCRRCPYLMVIKRKHRKVYKCTHLDDVQHRKHIFETLPLEGKKRFNTANICFLGNLHLGKPAPVKRSVVVCQACPHYMKERKSHRCDKATFPNVGVFGYKCKTKYEIVDAPHDCPYTVELLVLTQKES